MTDFVVFASLSVTMTTNKYRFSHPPIPIDIPDSPLGILYAFIRYFVHTVAVYKKNKVTTPCHIVFSTHRGERQDGESHGHSDDED